MTLYDALINFRDLYETRLTSSSRRISDPIATDWQRVSNEYDLYYEAIALGDYTSADDHITNIINILNGYGIIVDEPSQGPLPININVYPSTIFVVCDDLGVPVSYSGSYADIIIREGGVDTTTSWTLAIQTETGVTSNISGGNRVNITSLTTTSGEVIVRCTRTGYTDQDVTIVILKSLQGSSGGVSDTVLKHDYYNSGIEHVNSVGIGDYNNVVGYGNVTKLTELNGFLVESFVASTNTLTIKASEGDQTAYFAPSNQILIYYDLNENYQDQIPIDETKFEYISAIISSSSFATNTTVILSAGYTITTAIEDFINTYSALDRITALSDVVTSAKFNNVFGNINKSSARYNNIFGVGNITNNLYCNLFGNYSTTSTNGEISFSSSSSPVKKVLYLLEAHTQSTDQIALKTLSRAVNGEDSYADEIRIPEYSIFDGTVTVLGYYAFGVIANRIKYAIQFGRATGNVHVTVAGPPVEITEYTIGAPVVTIKADDTLPYLQILVTPDSSANRYFVAWVEGIVSDFPLTEV